jgi:AcrR family transcriptional regulator
MATDSTRDRLLGAAKEMVLDRFEQGSSPADAMAFLTPAAVAERAGASRGSIYHHWGDTPEGEEPIDEKPFRRFLDELAEEFWEDTVEVEELAIVAAGLPGDENDFVRELARFEMLRLTAPGGDLAAWKASTVMAIFGADYVEPFRRTTGALARLYGAILGRHGRRMRDPLDAEQLARAIAMLTDGMVISDLLEPGEVARPVRMPRDDHDWTLFGLAARAIVDGMTEKIPGEGGPRRASGNSL